MKKILSLCSIVLLCVCCFFGCASTSLELANYAPVAVVTVLGNQSLPWVESENFQADANDDFDDETGLLSTMVNKLMNGNNPEYLTAADRVQYAAESFSYLLEENAGIAVIPSETVLHSQAYTDASRNIFSYLESRVAAQGYKNLMQLGAKRARLIMQETGAKSLLMADFVFRKKLVSGTKQRGEVAAYVTMEVRFLDERGRETLNKTYEVLSANTVHIASTKYNVDELLDLYAEAIETVINQFIVTNL